MSKYRLDYAYTCPDLDSEIRDAKNVISLHFEALLQELNPLTSDLLHTPEVKSWLKESTESLYGDLESIFENCRGINEDIRNAADQQIAECVNELEDAQSYIKELENE